MTFSYETRTARDGSVTLRKTINLGFDPVTGKRRQKIVTGATVGELRRRYNVEMRKRDTGEIADDGRRLLGDYLDYWLETYARGSVKPTTFAAYKQMMLSHVKPAIGNVRLGKLQPAHLADLYRDKLAGGRLDGKPGGLSPRTVRYIHLTLHEALSHAVKWGFVYRNVADAVDPPKAHRGEMRTWDVADVGRFLAAAERTRYAPVFGLALLTGLRRGELLGLRWQDVDLERGTLTVRQTLIDQHGRLSFSTPKTHRSRRPVELPSSAVALLKAHRRTQAEERLALGPAWEASDLVFTSEVGTPVHPRNLFRAFRAVLKAAKVPEARFHDLRHTHATLLFKADVHPKIVSERLGHATIGLTLDTYSHVLPGMQREAVDRLDALLDAGRQSA